MRYAVISPEWEEVVPILDDGTGPSEYGCAYVEVEAQTKREAKIAAVKHPDFAKWVDGQRDDCLCPFTGLRVEELREGTKMSDWEADRQVTEAEETIQEAGRPTGSTRRWLDSVDDILP